jgi:hypothetical protein
VKVWLIVVLAFLALVTRYGLPMRSAHALLALRWSDQVTQPVYKNDAADCVRMFVGLCRHQTPVAVSLAFDGPFLDLSVARPPSLESRWLPRGLDVVLDGLASPTEIGHAKGPFRLDPIPRQNSIRQQNGQKGGFATAFS